MGTLGEEWGADLPIQALPLIRETLPEIRYMILGSGPDERKLRNVATELRVDDCVYFLGKQAYQDLPGFLAEADIGVATSRENDFRKYASPLKIYEYMAAGLPVIGTNFGETHFIIEKARAGLTVDFTPNAFAKAALVLLCNQEMYELCSTNAIDFARQHDWELLFDHELDFIKRLVSPSGMVETPRLAGEV
jgi:glycosyltransferase involved in cell wall biosynthesis